MQEVLGDILMIHHQEAAIAVVVVAAVPRCGEAIIIKRVVMIAGAAVEVAIAAIVGVGGYARLDGIAQSIENGDAIAFRHDHLVVEALRHGLEAEAGGRSEEHTSELQSLMRTS